MIRADLHMHSRVSDGSYTIEELAREAAAAGLDAIAVGPTLSDVHTPDESMELASAERFYELLIDVLKRLAA
mgnify:CR=1 FL=1